MTFWTTPTGEKLTFKQFLERWKGGIRDAAMSASPLSQVKSQIKFTWIIVIGLMMGIGVSIFNMKNLWWLMVVLLGALGNSGVGLIGLYQKKKMLNDFEFNEDLLKGGNENDEKLFERQEGIY